MSVLGALGMAHPHRTGWICVSDLPPRALTMAEDLQQELESQNAVSMNSEVELKHFWFINE